MLRLFLTAGLSTIITLGSAAAATDGPGSAVFGRELAIGMCADCHVVQPGQQPDEALPAPNLVDRMDDPAMTELALRSYMQTSHPVMPNIMLNREQTDDLIAYLLTLKQAASR